MHRINKMLKNCSDYISEKTNSLLEFLQKNQSNTLTSLIIISQALIAIASIKAINANSISSENTIKMILNHISINSLQNNIKSKNVKKENKTHENENENSFEEIIRTFSLTSDSTKTALVQLVKDYEKCRELAIKYSKRTFLINYIIILFAFGMINWGIAYFNNNRFIIFILFLFGLIFHILGIITLFI